MQVVSYTDKILLSYRYTIDTGDNYHFIKIHNIMASTKWDLSTIVSEPKYV